MRVSPKRTLQFTAFIVMSGFVVGALVLLPLSCGVWLPDAFFRPTNTLASYTATNGYRFRVVQYWNGVDFYNTELHILSPDGRSDVRILDADDSKTWSVPLRVYEPTRMAVVTLGGGRRKTVSW